MSIGRQIDRRTKVLELRDDESTKYAILSHRWIDPTARGHFQQQSLMGTRCSSAKSISDTRTCLAALRLKSMTVKSPRISPAATREKIHSYSLIPIHFVSRYTLQNEVPFALQWPLDNILASTGFTSLITLHCSEGVAYNIRRYKREN